MKVVIRVVAALALVSSSPAEAQRPVELRPAFNELGAVGADPYASAESPDGRLVLLVTATGKEGLQRQWRIFDRSTNQVRAIPNSTGVEVAWSPRSNEVAFARPDDRSEWLYIWTQRVNPRTGEPQGLPRRVSLTPGRGPAYSPDGRTIAFTALPPSGPVAKPRIILVPAGGGQERVLVQAPGFVQQISWAPDGQTIFYRYHTGAARGEIGRPETRINRVRVSDGSVQTVKGPVMELVRGNGGGRYLAYLPLEAGRTVAITSADGVELGRFSLPRDLWPLSWSKNGVKLLAALARTPSVAAVAPISGGPQRSLSTYRESFDYWPSWSPDSRQLALTTLIGVRRQIVVQPASGGARRHVPTRHEPEFAALWSPDQRYLAFRADNSTKLVVVELATGAEAVIAESPGGVAAPRWRRDGRSLLLAIAAGERTELREVSVGGAHTTVRQFNRTLESMRIAIPTDSTVLFADDQTLRVAHLRTRDERILVAADDPLSNSWRFTGISASRDGAFIVLAASNEPSRFDLHVLSVNGGARRTVRVNGAPSGEFVWHPDGRHVVALIQDQTQDPVLYLVPLNGDPPRALQAATSESVSYGLSPDGAAYVYASVLPASSVLFEIDLTRALARYQPTNSR